MPNRIGKPRKGSHTQVFLHRTVISKEIAVLFLLALLNCVSTITLLFITIILKQFRLNIRD